MLSNVLGRRTARISSESFSWIASSVRFSSSEVLKNFQWAHADSEIEFASTPPSAWYTDRHFFDMVEKKHTFRRWLPVARLEDFKKEGDYFAGSVLGEPFIIVKSGSKPTSGSELGGPDSHNLKAFYNVCRHHAAVICDDGTGSLKDGRLTCPYHGWQYTTDGKLAKATELRGCKNFNTKDMALIPIQLDVMGPWVFINFEKEVRTGTVLGDNDDLSLMEKLLEGSGYLDLRHVRSKSYTIDCNWKVFIDNYLDGGYHVPYAHLGLASLLDMKQYTRKAYRSFFLQSCPGQVSTTATTEDTGENSADRARIVDSHSSDRIDSSKGEALYLYMYPNICINRYGRWMDTNIVWPIGPNKCVVQFDWFVHPDLCSNPALIDKCIEDSDRVQQEDTWLCERVQKGLESSGYDTGRYAPTMEAGEFMFHKRLHDDLMASVGLLKLKSLP